MAIQPVASMSSCHGLTPKSQVEPTNGGQAPLTDNLAYGTTIKVYTGPDGIITALTDYGVDELRDMIAAARCSPTKWDQFIDDFVNDPGIIARVKAQTPR